MADPFEVRMRFTDQLRQLNASVTSAQKAARYAIKYHDLAEDLHSCILEQLERNNMNTRANIMYFIEHFLDLAHKEHHDEYVEMMQRDIIRVVDAVAPDDGSGAANIKVVRKVLRALQSKDLLDTEAVSQIEEVLRERETASHDLGVLASPSTNPLTGAGSAIAAAAADGPDTMMVDLGDMPPSQTMPPPPAPRLDRKQIEQRMEEDRERHKRQREGDWEVPSGPYAELDKLWEETSDLGEDDERMVVEEELEWQTCREASLRSCPHQGAGGTSR